MRLERLTAPADVDVLGLYSVSQFKADARVDADAEDTRIERLILDTHDAMDGPSGWLGRALLSQRWRIHLDAFASAVELPLVPLVTVDAVRYRDASGTWTTLADSTVSPEVTSSAYEVIGGDGAVIRLRPSGSWPTVSSDYAEPIQIDATFGYGAPSDVPRPIARAIGIAAVHAFDNPAAGIPEAAADLVRSYRTWRF